MKIGSIARANVLGFAAILASVPAFGQASLVPGSLQISLDGAAWMGEKSATVTMVEFSDFQCPLSGQFFNWTLRQVMNDYVRTGKVRYVFRDFPIESIHPLAEKAAEAAHCAGEQGKYWEMHDRFFRNQMSIEPGILPLHALMLRLNVDQFRACLDSGKYAAVVRDSVAEGEAAGIRGTPGFFLGITDPGASTMRVATFVNGSQPYGDFKVAIDNLLLQAKDTEAPRAKE